MPGSDLAWSYIDHGLLQFTFTDFSLLVFAQNHANPSKGLNKKLCWIGIKSCTGVGIGVGIEPRQMESESESQKSAGIGIEPIQPELESESKKSAGVGVEPRSG